MTGVTAVTITTIQAAMTNIYTCIERFNISLLADFFKSLHFFVLLIIVS